MATTTQTAGVAVPPELRRPPMLLAVMAWMALFGIGLLYLALQAWQIESFFNLGNFVPRLIGLILAIIGVVGLISIPVLWSLNNAGRLIAMILNYFAAAFTLLLAGHALGLYLGIDTLTANIYFQPWVLLGLPLGYALIWAGRRFVAEDSPARLWLRRAGMGVMIASGVILVLISGWPGLLLQNPGAALGQLVQPGVLLALAAGTAFLFFGVQIMRMGDLFGETILQREAWQGWLFLLPNFVNFLLFFALPLILSLYLSFTSYDAISDAEFIGTQNYQQLLSLSAASVPAGERATGMLPQFHNELVRIPLGSTDLVIGARDALFWESLARTIRYCVLLLLLSVAPAFGLAMLLNSRIPGMKFFRAVYFLPSIAAVVGVAMIWQWLYNPVIGYINYAITSVVNGLNGLLGTSITDPAILWLSDESVMLISAVIMAAWQVVGFNTVILLAGLQGVPRDLIEASTVDGAGAWTRFRRIILPLLGPTTFFVIVTTLISGMQAFSEFFTLYATSVSDARLTVVYYLYLQGFTRFNMGYASATAWVLFVVIFIITLIQFRFSRSSEAYRD